MSKSLKIILIHGNGGSTAESAWFPYVKAELEKLGLEVIAKTFPDNEVAREEIWLPFLKNELGADENTIIIGHSSGASAALRFAETNKIYGSVLVGAAYTDLGDATEKLSGYFNRPWDWGSIKGNQKWVILFASTDDPYIPISEPRFINDHLNAEYHESTNHGHFGDEKNPHTEFPELVETLKAKLQLS